MILSYIFTRWLSMIYKKGIHHSQHPLWHRTLVFKVTSEWPVTFETIVIEMAKYKCLPDIKTMAVVHVVQLTHCCTIQYHNIHSHKVKGHESTTKVDLGSRQILISSLSESLSQAMMRKSAHLQFWPWFATISLNSHDVLWKYDQRLFCFDYKITLNISW